jgi:LmbE family N-acetylglucosaminyl deacetylase
LAAVPKRVLVVSPHPDDESIGCGGSLRKHVLGGDSVQIVWLTSGEAGGHGASLEETRRIREAEAREAAATLGVERIEFWREPDGRLRATRSLVRRLARLVAEVAPHVIYTTHDREAHADHRAAARLLRQALRANPGPKECEALMFEVWTPLQRLDRIVDITEFIDVKIAAIRAYPSQCEAVRFDDALLGLARYRGALHCWPEGDYAEVFADL